MSDLSERERWVLSDLSDERVSVSEIQSNHHRHNEPAKTPHPSHIRRFFTPTRVSLSLSVTHTRTPTPTLLSPHFSLDSTRSTYSSSPLYAATRHIACRTCRRCRPSSYASPLRVYVCLARARRVSIENRSRNQGHAR